MGKLHRKSPLTRIIQNNKVDLKPVVRILEEYSSKKFSFRLNAKTVILSTSVKKGVFLKNFAMFTGNTCVGLSFSIKLQAGGITGMLKFNSNVLQNLLSF